MDLPWGVIAVYAALAAWLMLFAWAWRRGGGRSWRVFAAFGVGLLLFLNVRYFVDGIPASIAFFIGIYDVLINLGVPAEGAAALAGCQSPDCSVWGERFAYHPEWGVAFHARFLEGPELRRNLLHGHILFNSVAFVLMHVQLQWPGPRRPARAPQTPRTAHLHRRHPRGGLRVLARLRAPPGRRLRREPLGLRLLLHVGLRDGARPLQRRDRPPRRPRGTPGVDLPLRGRDVGILLAFPRDALRARSAAPRRTHGGDPGMHLALGSLGNRHRRGVATRGLPLEARAGTGGRAGTGRVGPELQEIAPPTFRRAYCP